MKTISIVVKRLSLSYLDNHFHSGKEANASQLFIYPQPAITTFSLIF